MAGRAAGLKVVLDASTFISAALKAGSVPEQALLRAVDAPNRLLLSQVVEDEYREVIFRPKFDRFVSQERRQRILDVTVTAAERVEPTEAVQECSDPKDDKYLALAAAGLADVIVTSDVRHCCPCTPGAASRSCARRSSWRSPDPGCDHGYRSAVASMTGGARFREPSSL